MTLHIRIIHIAYAAMVAASFLLLGCRGDSLVIPAEQNRVGDVDPDSPVAGLDRKSVV